MLCTGKLPADHRSDQGVVIELGHRCRDDPFPVAQHAHVIADLVDLLEVVRDVEDRDAALLHPAHPLEQPLDRVRLERSGRLVQDEDAGADREGAPDLDDLLLLDREPRGGLGDVEVEAPLEQQPPCLAAQLLPADERAFAAVQKDVLGDAQRRDHHRALVDARDALLPRGTVTEARRGLAVQLDRPAVGLEEPGEDADERRLAGAVAADQRVAFPGGHRDRDVHQRTRAAEGLPDPLGVSSGRPLVRPPALDSRRDAHLRL